MAAARNYSYSSRGRRRASRVFMVLMAGLLGTGAFFWYRNSKVPAALAAKPAPATPLVGPEPAVPVTDLPITAPAAAKPFDPQSSLALVAATKPVNATGFVPVAPTPPAVPNDKLLAAAKTKYDAGDLVAARAVLNDAVVYDKLPGPDAQAARTLLTEINRKLIFSPAKYNDPYVDLVKVEQGKGLAQIARQHAVPWEAICFRINEVSDRRIRMGQTLKVPHGPFHAVVNKSAFRMDLYLGGLPAEPGALYVISLPVGLGKDDSTPTGTWTCVQGSKGKNLDWTNPRTNEHFAGNDPKNPLGGYWIGLKGENGNAVGKTSYGIHGTIEQDSIGKQASMGCIRMGEKDIPFVYDLLSEGKSRILVRE